MFGRLDLESRECSNCHGSGKDPKKRTRSCPVCNDSKTETWCSTCGNKMPCPGTRNLMDQGHCISDEEWKEITSRKKMSIKTLNQLEEKEIHVGTKVRSLCTGDTGEITELTEDREGMVVWIIFEGSELTSLWPFQGKNVEILNEDQRIK